MEERPQPHAQRGAEPAAQPANTAVPSATFSISPPEAFDFAKPQEWQKWIRRFERFRVASNLDKSSEANQVYREIAQGSTRSLTPGKKALFGPGTPLSVVGVAREVLQCGDRSTTEDIYVLKHLKVALLSRPADIVVHLKSMFVRHGIPETVVTDNRPQFSALEPDIPDLRKVQRRERERRWMDVSNYNQRHGGRNRSNLAPGDQVWITHTKTTGTVTSAHPTPRSYLVNGPQGTLRRNRHHLVPMPPAAASSCEARQAPTTRWRWMIATPQGTLLQCLQ
ncbi:hypothetical protein SKAU_G00424080 [Synaphobranchus kaupii]|uniref:Uncharacterized protein n=1 Tax=Synaphobranchus kaupii TaxID=118154 RepID=A0A9Q1E5I8_SYNKA|nr:hypothetical protein SKAU_G00424080 [Synaphobranchus kaupii]